MNELDGIVLQTNVDDQCPKLAVGCRRSTYLTDDSPNLSR